MHLVFMSVSAELGGSETVLAALVRGMRGLHPDWRLTCVLPRQGPLESRLQSAGADVLVLPIPPALLRLGESSGATPLARGAGLLGAAAAVGGYTRRLRTLFARLEPDVIHSNGFKLHVLAARARPSETPLVWHIHEYVGRRALTRRLLHRYRHSASLAVTNSKSVERDLAQAVGLDLPIRTVYNAVDLNAFSPDGPVANLDAGVSPAPEGTVRIGLVATFGRWKGHEVFMRAIARLATVRPIRGYVVGGPVYDTAGSQYTLEELQALARGLGIGDRLVFTGVVDPIAPVLRALDVVVHASTQPEPFGLVIAEAMACGRTVIVSGAGGATEIVCAGRDALVHTPGDVESLASALSGAIDDPGLRTRLSAAARSSARARFDAARFAREFDDIYQFLAQPAAIHA